MALCHVVGYTSKTLRYGLCVTMGSHNFTCHPHTNHTCFYFPATMRHHTSAGTHCTYPMYEGMARLSWPAWLVTGEINVPHRELNRDTVTHPSANRARLS